MIPKPQAIAEELALGPRYALEVCALSLGASQGPAILVSAVPTWERALRTRVGEQLYALGASVRPEGQAWIGAVWLEPQRSTWQAELEGVARELPRGALLSVVLSLPLAVLRGQARPAALGTGLGGIWHLRAMLGAQSFRIERTFGFHTLWSSVLHRVARRIRARRPDWSDRLQHVMRHTFVRSGLALPLGTTALIEARAGMSP